MMYQIENQPTQLKEKIQQSVAQIPRTMEHTQKRFPVSPIPIEEQRQEFNLEKRIEKEDYVKQIKDLVGQVQNMLLGHEQQQTKAEHQALLRHVRDIQAQVDTIRQPEIKTEKIQEPVKKIGQELIGEQTYQPRAYETAPIELMAEPIRAEQMDRKLWIEKRRQLIEKLIQKIRVFEDLLVEKMYEFVHQSIKMEQFHFDLERELFEQIKKRFAELEEHFYMYGYEQECHQRHIKMFVLLRKQVKQIEELFYQIAGQTTDLRALKTKEQHYREQYQYVLEKVRGFRALLQEVFYYTCPESCEPRTERFEATFAVEPLTKLFNLISLPMFYDEEEIFGRQIKETEKTALLRKELEEIKLAKQELEMRLYETDRKVEQFKRHIELLEKSPKTEQFEYKPQQQIRAEFVQYTKPEEELIKISLKPTQQQTWYTTVEPRQWTGKFYEQEQQIQRQPITKYF
ncbi:hypothetical protein BpHYR1_029794 [Brachionus plicatilis]|uniref:Uncharacterized protein n=1 Tax=Brachionus plicatilis TaxID=10195 RepID=A0A3M7T4U4_BRAPC|nr:hypothetical protein BpHYR1_029794 [Brachionus plicatilis]